MAGGTNEVKRITEKISEGISWAIGKAYENHPLGVLCGEREKDIDEKDSPQNLYTKKGRYSAIPRSKPEILTSGKGRLELYVNMDIHNIDRGMRSRIERCYLEGDAAKVLDAADTINRVLDAECDPRFGAKPIIHISGEYKKIQRPYHNSRPVSVFKIENMR